MDPLKKSWQQDFEREVQEVLGDLGPRESHPPGGEISISDAVIPPAKVHVDLRTAHDMIRTLQAQVADQRRQVELGTRKLEDELRGRDRLKDLVVKLNQTLRTVTTEKQKTDYENETLSGRLKKSEVESEALGEAVKELKKLEGQMTAGTASLKSRIEELTMTLKLLEDESRTLKVRYEAAEKSYAQQNVEREQKLRDGLRDADQAKSEAARALTKADLMESRAAHESAERNSLESELKAAKESLDKLHLEFNSARDVASQSRLRGDDERDEWMETARKLRALLAKAEDEGKRHLNYSKEADSERETLRMKLSSTLEELEKEKAQAADDIRQWKNMETGRASDFRLELQKAAQDKERAEEHLRTALAEHSQEKQRFEEGIRTELDAHAQEKQRFEEGIRTELDAHAQEKQRLEERIKADLAAHTQEKQHIEENIRSTLAAHTQEIQRTEESHRIALTEHSREKLSLEALIEDARREAGAAHDSARIEINGARRSAADARRLVSDADTKFRSERESALEEIRESRLQVERDLETARKKHALEAQQAMEQVRHQETDMLAKIDAERARIIAEGRSAHDQAKSASRAMSQEGLDALERSRQLEAELRELEEKYRASKERTLKIETRQTAAVSLPPVRESRPSPKRGPSSNLVPRVFLGLLVSALVWAGIFFITRPRIQRHFVPFSHTTGLAWNGDDLWVSDWREEAIFLLGKTKDGLKVRERFPLPGSHITGLAIGGDRIYIADSWAGTIEQRRIGDGLPLEASWPSPGPSPSLLFFDGKYLWSADQSEGRVYRHDPIDLSVVESFPMKSRWAAVAVRDDKFWSVDSNKRFVLSHRWDKDLTPVQAYGLAELDRGRKPVSSFTWKGDSVWIGQEGSSRLLEVPWKMFKPRTD